MAPECVQVKIEIGHKSVCRTDTTQEGFTHDWVVFVRGADGSNVSHFVEKVVFHLHESFPKPKRVIKLPPYKVEESGYGSFMLMIEIYFRNKEEPKKVKFDYDLYLQLVGNPPVTNVRVEALTFSDPVEDFKKKLLKGGGVIVSSAGVSASSTSPSNPTNAAPLSKPDAMANAQPTFSPPTSSPPPQALVKNPKKTSPSTSGQQASALASKAPKMRERETPPPTSSMGIKRSNIDDTSLQKVKKKKLEKTGEVIPKVVPKEVSIIGQPDLEKDKAKIKANTPSSKTELKERRKSGDTSGVLGQDKLKSSKTYKESKKEGLKDNKEKVKKDKMKKPEEKASDEPKVQKLTVKRTSSDAWASTTKGGNSGQGKATLDALLNEFGADDSADSDDEDGDMQTPVASHAEISMDTEKTNANKGKKAAVKAKTNSNAPNISSPKMNGVKKKDVSSPQNGKTAGDANPLVELWTRISTTEDRDTLQKIVDIVESTGKFEVTDSTFDFDLCCLDSETIDKLRESLSVR